MDLAIDTSEAGTRTLVAVSGELDVHTAAQLETALRDLIDAGQADLVVDLRGLDFLDSTGLGVLVRALKWSRDADGGLQVVAAEDKIVKVFTITGLDSAMSLVRSISSVRGTSSAGGPDSDVAEPAADDANGSAPGAG